VKAVELDMCMEVVFKCLNNLGAHQRFCAPRQDQPGSNENYEETRRDAESPLQPTMSTPETLCPFFGIQYASPLGLCTSR